MPALQPALLDWYDRHGRELPWRCKTAQTAEPYRVWLSEIMLQQTTVATVKERFETFTRRWPTVAALAAAPLDDVLTAWAGLGYYARARNLHKAAGVIIRDHGGRFPDTPEMLRQLPGVGPYTAGAIAAIAFNRSCLAIDGNIERVIARLFAIETPLPAAKPMIAQAAGQLVPQQRCGDYTQAMMDLGAMICTPRRPDCPACPLQMFCHGHHRNIAAELPKKAAKKTKPLRHGTAFVIEDQTGAVLLRRRPERGLLGGMMEVPATAWDNKDADGCKGDALPYSGDWHMLPGDVRHTFTHFHLRLSVKRLRVLHDNTECPPEYRWVPLEKLSSEALPTLMKKILRHALGQTVV